MICPNCGESNSPNFRYCGMCGTSLDVRKPVGAPRVTSSQEISRPASTVPAETRIPVETRVPVAAHASQLDVDERAPLNGGPSFLGLNDSFSEPRPAERSTFQDQSFSGTSSFYELEEGNVGARRLILLLLLLAGLGAGGWWAYSNYNKTGAFGRHIPITPAAQPEGSEPSADNSTTAKVPNGSASTDANATKTEPPAESQNSAPTLNSESDQAKADQPKADQAKSDQTKANQAKANEAEANESASSAPPPAREERPSTPAKAGRTRRTPAASRTATRPSPTVAEDDRGAAEFRRGEAYLYGRGSVTNCSEAIKSLKAASAKQNAKARSTFGTMYATGHCVNRDLPTSYTWFALALQADPNNQILEKDLVAVWNQMTPPERQTATRSKQASQ